MWGSRIVALRLDLTEVARTYPARASEERSPISAATRYICECQGARISPIIYLLDEYIPPEREDERGTPREVTAKRERIAMSDNFIIV